MNLRQRFEERIKKKEQEIKELEAKIHEARVYIQAFQDSIKLLPKDQSDNATAQDLLRPGSTNAKVYGFLKATGTPMHVGAILEAIGKVNNKANRVSLSGALGAYVRRKEIFTRPAPNTFGLIEMESNEPPDDFGLPTENEIREVRPKGDDDIPF